MIILLYCNVQVRSIMAPLNSWVLFSFTRWDVRENAEHINILQYIEIRTEAKKSKKYSSGLRDLNSNSLIFSVEIDVTLPRDFRRDNFQLVIFACFYFFFLMIFTIFFHWSRVNSKTKQVAVITDKNNNLEKKICSVPTGCTRPSSL